MIFWIIFPPQKAAGASCSIRICPSHEWKLLSSVGHNKAVAEVFGLKISGFVAWLMWRGLYLLRIPTFARKSRLFLEWNWAMFFPPISLITGIAAVNGVQSSLRAFRSHFTQLLEEFQNEPIPHRRRYRGRPDGAHLLSTRVRG